MLVRQAITTKYIGPSNVKGSRVKARAAAGSITLHWDDALNSEDNHRAAAQAYATKMGWHGKYYQGSLPDDSGYCFVCVDQREPNAAFEVIKP
jgi:hypothetical protein